MLFSYAYYLHNVWVIRAIPHFRMWSQSLHTHYIGIHFICFFGYIIIPSLWPAFCIFFLLLQPFLLDLQTCSRFLYLKKIFKLLFLNFFHLATYFGRMVHVHCLHTSFCSHSSTIYRLAADLTMLVQFEFLFSSYSTFTEHLLLVNCWSSTVWEGLLLLCFWIMWIWSSLSALPCIFSPFFLTLHLPLYYIQSLSFLLYFSLSSSTSVITVIFS